MSKWISEWTEVTPAHCEARWSCGKPGELFKCAFCGHKFVPGDVFKCIYTNDLPGAWGNPLCCSTCRDHHGGDQEKLREAWIEKWRAWKDFINAPTNWWLKRHMIDDLRQ